MRNRHIPAHSLWPCAAAFLVCLVALGALLFRAMQRCGGHFGYPMDDTYIHMAMAKNFSLHGVWGITAYSFSSSTSSPLYTLLLAVCYALTGVREVTPLLLNIAAALALLLWCHFLLLRQGIHPAKRFFVLAFLVLAVPLPILIFGGMEHVLHAVLTLLFVHTCSLALVSSEHRLAFALSLFALAATLVLTRYEALFLIAAASALFLLQRRWLMAFGIALSAAIPVIVYGAISMRHGWFPLPTSLLLKANLPSAPSSGMYPGFVLSLFRNASRGSHVFVLVIIAGALLYRISRKRNTVWTYTGIGLILFIASALMHLTLARTGWFFRYEAYLVALGIIVTAIAIADVGVPDSRRLFGAALLLLFALLTARAAYAFYVTPQAVTDIFDQQYQMGLFARRYLDTQTLVLNDIGAVSFLSNARVLDLIGLGSIEPARARMRRQYDPEWINRWTLLNHASVAIVYPTLAPSEWSPLETWSIPGNYMSGSDSVGFYVFDPALKPALAMQLNQFAASLPPRVVVRQDRISIDK